MHLNAFYDLDRHTYTDALIKPVHNKDEFLAFCVIVDRHEILPDDESFDITVKFTLLRNHSRSSLILSFIIPATVI